MRIKSFIVVNLNLVRKIFGKGGLALIGGLLLSAIVAAAMSSADSQLLASSSAFFFSSRSDVAETVVANIEPMSNDIIKIFPNFFILHLFQISFMFHIPKKIIYHYPILCNIFLTLL